MADRLELSNFCQVKQASIEFGDLTVFVGPQATGKSIALQLLKLLVDKGTVVRTLKRHGLDWRGDYREFLDIYFGEGMRRLVGDHTSARWRGKEIDWSRLISFKNREQLESLFYIPAQRVLTLPEGWPRPFSSYRRGDPFAVRDFSEKLRLLMEGGSGRGESIFPKTHRLKADIRKVLERNIFGSFELKVDRHTAQKRLILAKKGDDSGIPFMAWSAGQREFTPLLLGLFWLLPPAAISRREGIDWVVIEEPEMGLHPNAISAVLVLILDLLSRGYRVCMSTHSPHVLDVVWALRTVREHGAKSECLLDLFELPKNDQTRKLVDAGMKEPARVYYFERESGEVRDISGLDPGSEDAREAGWGGLSEFSGRVADVVASVVNS